MKAYELARLLLSCPNLPVFRAHTPKIMEITDPKNVEYIKYRKALNEAETSDDIANLIKDWDSTSHLREYIVL